MFKRIFAVLLALCLVQEPASAFFWGRKTAPEKASAAAPAVETPTPAVPLENGPLRLEEAYALALKRSEALASQAEEIALAEARFYRSFQYFLPDARFRVTRREQDVNTDGGSSSEEGISSDSRRRVTPENKFVIRQPLFQGLRQLAALRATGADKRQQRLEYKRAEELLFIDVMDAFYSALQAEEDVRTLQAIHKLLGERIDEIGKRVELGRSRESEQKTSLADAKLTAADLVVAEAQRDIARNLLEFYVGVDLETRELADDMLPKEMAGLDFYLDQSQTRSDVRAAEEGLRVASEKVLAARSGFLPEAWLDVNYYTRRVGFQSGNDWDVLLTFDVPIFDAGQTFADVTEAQVLRRRAELERDLARRTADLEVRNAFEDLTSARLAETAFDEAGTAAKENYDLLTEEYRLTLVNNLDVLDALRRYEDIRRRQTDARFDARRAYWRFRVALGDVSKGAAA